MSVFRAWFFVLALREIQCEICVVGCLFSELAAMVVEPSLERVLDASFYFKMPMHDELVSKCRSEEIRSCIQCEIHFSVILLRSF